MRLTVRIVSSASPDSRLPRLAPPSTSSPLPVARRRSISTQSSGEEHARSRPVSFSTQRNAGMSSLEPSRIPAWLAPVCDERSVSHSASRYPSSAIQPAIVGALPSRMASRRTGSARPSISRKMIPGTWWSRSPWRRAMRRVTLRLYWSSSFVPRTACRTRLAAAITSDATSASPNESTRMSSGRSRFAAISSPASAMSTSRKPATSMNGSRSAARIGGSSALSTATSAATRNAAPVCSSPTPGTTDAAIHTATAPTPHETSVRSRPSRSGAGCQCVSSP